jgi:adenylate cyclase
VLVGRNLKTTTDLNSVEPDMFLTPYFSTVQALMPGVEVHANVVANMITGETLTESPRHFALLLVIAVTVLIAVTMRSGHPVSGGLWASALIVAVALVEWYLFRYQRVWLPAGAAMATVTLGYAGQGATGFLREQARRREIRRAFALYVSPEIVAEIVAHPETLRLGGDRRELTLLFTDLAGFTSISEKLPAEEVAQLLNRHLTEMTEIVMRHGGTVDKFIGDAVMAFWGAPIADADQSLHSVQAAIEMQRTIARMRAELVAAGGPALRMRIGLHRGECIIGNMGGINRFSYTAVGDCVNLASRLEGVNNVYGTGILLSDSVAGAVAGRLSLRPVDSVRVKGKVQPVELFTPCDDPALAVQTAAALAVYREGDWTKALAQWEALAAAFPDDSVARVFVGRLRLWSRDGWPQPWDGVTTLEAK